MTEDSDSGPEDPDIKVDITNGKHVSINLDKGEWFIVSAMILGLTYMAGSFGWV